MRVEREFGQTGSLRACSLELLRDTTSQRNQEQYLQGLFYQRCIVVEGATDRAFYQRFLEGVPALDDKDVGFVACGGKGGTTHMAHLGSRIGLRVAFIYDFDALLFEPGVLRAVYRDTGGFGDPLEALWKAIEANEAVKPFIGKDDAGSTKARNAAVRALCEYDRKTGVHGEWAAENSAAFEAAVRTLSLRGIYIVPNGELESWAPALEKGARFAELAHDAMASDSASVERVKAFLMKVVEYLL